MTEYDLAVDDSADGEGQSNWTETPPGDPGGQTGLRVAMPSGAVQPVWNQYEFEYLSDKVDRYLTDNAFTNISDLQDVDRMLFLELMVHRWGTFLGQGADYAGGTFDEGGARRDVEKYSSELRMLKKNIGIDKPARERQKGEGSVAAYIANLTEKAKLFGIHREKQLDKALELLNELIGMVTFSRNCDDEERAEMHVMPDDIVEWIWEVARPEYEEIDAYFREHSHRYWVRTL